MDKKTEKPKIVWTPWIRKHKYANNDNETETILVTLDKETEKTQDILDTLDKET